jgi:mitochondrial chaperone BCS1
VNFTNASRWQAEGLYKRFFPASDAKPDNDAVLSHMAISSRRRKPCKIVRLPSSEIEVLAKRFSEQIPENEFSASVVLLR